MPTPLAERIVSDGFIESQRRIADAANDESLDWEAVSAIAGEENKRMMALMEGAESEADGIVEANMREALNAGIFALDKALPITDPDDRVFLHEGVNALVVRVTRQVSEDRVLPMNYMDPEVRKILFLLETFVRARSEEEE